MAAIGLVAATGALGVAVVILVALTSPLGAKAIRPMHRRLVLHDPEPARSADERPAPPTTEPLPRRQRPASDEYRPTARSTPGRTGSTRRWDAATVAALTDPDLCLAWRVSYVALQRHTVRDRPTIVSFRAVVLDELQRRHPTEFHRWISAGARAASNPARYLRTNSSAQKTPPHDPPSPQPPNASTGVD